MVLTHDFAPHVLHMLKQKGVVYPTVGKVKLISLVKMQAALLRSGQPADHVAAIMRVHKSLLPPQAAPPAPAPAPPSNDINLGAPVPPQAHQDQYHHPRDQEMSPAPPPDVPPQPQASEEVNQPARMAPPAINPHRWPTRIPELAFPPVALRDDYGLKTIIHEYASRADIPVAQELPLLEAWCKEPVELSRGLDYPKPVKNVTYEGTKDTILGFTGFMLKVRLRQLCDSLASRTHLCALVTKLVEGNPAAA